MRDASSTYHAISEKLIKARTLKEEATKKLKADFHLTPKQARLLIKKLKRSIAKTESSIEKELEQWYEEYGHLIEDDRR